MWMIRRLGFFVSPLVLIPFVLFGSAMALDKIFGCTSFSTGGGACMRGGYDVNAIGRNLVILSFLSMNVAILAFALTLLWFAIELVHLVRWILLTRR
jgi:hypothetical protein